MSRDNTDDETDEPNGRLVSSSRRRRLLKGIGAVAAVGAASRTATAQDATVVSGENATPLTATIDAPTSSPRTNMSAASSTENETPTPTATPTATETSAPSAATETPTPTATSEEGDDRALAQLGQTLTLTNYSIRVVEEEERAEITVEATNQLAQQVVLSDVLGGVAGEGVTSVPQERRTIPSGKVELSKTVGVFDDELAALGVAVAGGAATISTGLPEDGGARVGLLTGTLTGIGTMALGTGFAAWRKVNDQNDEPESAWDDDGGLL